MTTVVKTLILSNILQPAVTNVLLQKHTPFWWCVTKSYSKPNLLLFNNWDNFWENGSRDLNWCFSLAHKKREVFTCTAAVSFHNELFYICQWIDVCGGLPGEKQNKWIIHGQRGRLDTLWQLGKHRRSIFLCMYCTVGLLGERKAWSRSMHIKWLTEF